MQPKPWRLTDRGPSGTRSAVLVIGCLLRVSELVFGPERDAPSLRRAELAGGPERPRARNRSGAEGLEIGLVEKVVHPDRGFVVAAELGAEARVHQAIALNSTVGGVIDAAEHTGAECVLQQSERAHPVGQFGIVAGACVRAPARRLVNRPPRHGSG